MSESLRPGSFPAGFIWAASTAGHQNEGDNVDSDTWFLENVSPTVFRERSGKAVDGWNRWASDLDLAVEMGLSGFRFSVEWSRVEPVPGRIDAAALDHYESVIDGCWERGLTPIVTYNHFTVPHWFAALGGWLDSDSDDRFGVYCDAVTGRFGDRIGFAVTLNEPNLPRMLSWVLPDAIFDLQRATLAAASAAAGVERYRAANIVAPEDFDAMEAGLAAAHRAGRAAIRAGRSDLPVGLAIAMEDDVAHGSAVVRDRKREEAYGLWLRLARDDDFVGVQNYERRHYGPGGSLPAPEGAILNDMGSAVEPGSLGGAVRYAFQMAQVPILVTEHGVAAGDDSIRVELLEPALTGLRDAMNDGVPVLGYCHWTLIDNFEWTFGFQRSFGLHSVDRTTFERTPKPSARELARLIARNSEEWVASAVPH